MSLTKDLLCQDGTGSNTNICDLSLGKSQVPKFSER